MRTRIYKYRPPLLARETRIEIPAGAQFLSVQFQEGGMAFWYLVDIDEPPEPRLIRVYGTGWPIEPEDGPLRHLATLQQPGTHLVWHVFEVQGA
jgi:hypothetical protein